MLWFQNLKVGKKLGLAFALLLALTAGLGVIAVTRLQRVNEQSNVIATSWLPSVQHAGRMATLASNVRSTHYRHITAADAAAMNEAERLLETTVAKLKVEEQAYQKLISSDDERQLYESFLASWDDYQKMWDKIQQTSRAGRAEEARNLLVGDAKLKFDAASDQLEKLIELNNTGAQAASALGTQTYESGRFVTIAVIFVCLLVGIASAVIISRAIANPLRAITLGTQRLALGDTDQRMDISSKDEVGELAEAFRQIVASQQTLAKAASRLAAGDLAVELAMRSDKDTLGKSFIELRQVMQQLIAETGTLIQASKDGLLETRGDANRFHGAYRELVSGVNDMLDAVIRPVNEAAVVLEKMAARDLTARVVGDYKGDHQKIKESINSAGDALQSALGDVSVVSAQVASASNEIASGSQQLAQGSSEQASSLEEVSSSLQELASMTRQNAGNAKEARALVESARTSVDHGVQGIERLSQAMDKIKASSDSTAKIVKTIDEIAFQTNLLALNAAVEAARAGDAGKGFAVVAEEVRNLAMRSADAAKQTAALIEESVRNAGSGVTLSHDVVTHLGEIHQRVNKVSEVMSEISAASDQQSQGVSQINTAVEQMNTVTQQVAANSEESASAAEELSSQSARMRELVGQFRIATNAQQSALLTRSAAPTRAAQTRRAAAPAPQRPPVAKAKEPGNAAVLAGAGATLAAEQVIPFDDDADTLGDF